jgi:hypothetical protein
LLFKNKNYYKLTSAIAFFVCGKNSGITLQLGRLLKPLLPVRIISRFSMLFSTVSQSEVKLSLPRRQRLLSQVCPRDGGSKVNDAFLWRLRNTNYL